MTSLPPSPLADSGPASPPSSRSRDSKNRYLSFFVKNGLCLFALSWASLVTSFYLLRFSLLPFLDGVRGWLDSLP